MGSQKINIPLLGGFLGAIAAIAAGLLAFVYSATAEARAEALQKVANAALEKVLPSFDQIARTVEMQSAEGWPIKFYVAEQAGAVVGYAGEVITPKGFSGNISVMVGLETDGVVRAVIVTANNETPGLGTVITDRKAQKTITDLFKGGEKIVGLVQNSYLDQYDGKAAGDTAWKLKKDGGEFDAKTGATITSRAVCGAVYAVSKTCVANKGKLLEKGSEQ